ncbi:helix-turn-helix protein, partial [Orenia metallireducens]
MCKVLEVSRSGYYKWLKRKPNKRKEENDKLKLKIAEIYWQSKVPMVALGFIENLETKAFRCNKKRVERLMKELGLKAIQKRKFKATTNSNHNLPVNENILNREFDVKERNKVWVS